MSIEQIPVGVDNFCYVIYCPVHKKAAVIDPGSNALKISRFLDGKHLEAQYLIATHSHYDHIGALSSLKQKYPTSVIVASEADGKKLGLSVEHIVTDGDTLALGEITLTIIHTPGHTPDSICILVDNEALLTGDTLFIDDCGRTDLQGGNLEQMFRTLKKKIFLLPDHLVVYPGHNYGKAPFDTLGNQKKTNKTLTVKTLEEFSLLP